MVTETLKLSIAQNNYQMGKPLQSLRFPSGFTRKILKIGFYYNWLKEVMKHRYTCKSLRSFIQLDCVEIFESHSYYQNIIPTRQVSEVKLETLKRAIN